MTIPTLARELFYVGGKPTIINGHLHGGPDGVDVRIQQSGLSLSHHHGPARSATTFFSTPDSREAGRNIRAPGLRGLCRSAGAWTLGYLQ